jgi:hypothetical protein
MFMANANKKETLLATDWEIFFLAIIFSFLFWAVYPGERIIRNALEENKNLDLTEIYLKNIAKKYPSSFEINFALAEIYLKQGKYQKAEEELKPVNAINDKDLLAKKELFLARIALFSLNKTADKETLKKLELYYSSSSFTKLSEREKYLSEYILTLNNLGLYKEASRACLSIMKGAAPFEDKKLCLKLYLKSLRAGNLLKKELSSLDPFSKDFALDDEAANEIMRAYLEAQEPEKSAAYAQKILRIRKIL